jgi:hypothetical protein
MYRDRGGCVGVTLVQVLSMALLRRRVNTTHYTVHGHLISMTFLDQMDHLSYGGGWG